MLEVAAAARAWPRVADAWRLDRFGNPGVTALFAGEPGTGKTLAAEVIAAEVGLDLMEVDLSRLVSKWVGETEKNLDAVFTEAEASNCVLFFDEADALFGQRGEVSRGTDRYANLEVGYLLQRLERYDGLVDPGQQPARPTSTRRSPAGSTTSCTSRGRPRPSGGGCGRSPSARRCSSPSRSTSTSWPGWT